MRFSLVACLVLSLGLSAVEGPIIDIPVPTPKTDAAEINPGRATPAAPAKAMAIEFTWEHYRSVVVIGDGVGQVRPAWVATYEAPVAVPGLTLLDPIFGLFGYHNVVKQPVEKLAVAYRAQAYVDATGRVHLDARQAVISGPQVDGWSPDSFVFTLPNLVATEDDRGDSNEGIIERIVDAIKDPELYRAFLTKVQVVVGDGI